MFENWKEKKKIKDLQKVIDKLNKALERFTKREKFWLDQAAKDLEWARRQEGEYKLIVLEIKEAAERSAKRNANYKPPLLKELARIESRKKRMIEALQDRALTTAQKKTTRFCFFF